MLKTPQTWLVLLPVFYVAVLFLGPWISSPLAIYAGAISQPSGALLPGYSTIDPNIGITSFALGRLAIHELLHGRLPVWNYFEGLGQPLMGEAQSAALFPLTMLLRLPGGQTIEHALLQIVGGLGAFYLLRTLQFTNRTSATVAVAFEFCSLFVWLKNAMINPIGFLIWLLVFCLRLIRAGRAEPWQADAIGMGVAAGFAVLGGFPETVLIFSVFLLAWAAFYGVRARLDGPALFRVAGRLASAVVIAVLIGSPLLIGLAAFIPAAIVGGHMDPTSAQAHLGWPAALKYLLPYVTGPIFAFPVEDETGSIGGYTGVTLIFLACLGFVATGRRAECLFWATAAALCLAASHGVPLIQPAVMTIPGFWLTAFYRQANVVWIICLMLLAANGLDAMAATPRTRLMLSVWGFAGVAAAVLYGSSDGWMRWARVPDVKPWAVASFTLGALFVLMASTAAFARRPGFVAGVLLVETALLFLLPILSLPTASKIDWGFIDFLRSNAVVGRVVNFSTNVIQPNFGSALGIRQLNFDDLPVPATTAAYIHDNLDPIYPKQSTIYLPDFPPNGDVSRRSAYMAEHIENYRQAGVKYVLSAPDGFGLASATQSGSNEPFGLADGESLNVRVALEPRGGTASQVGAAGRLRLRVATYGATSDGELHVRICGPGGPCESVNIDVRDLADNDYVTFSPQVSLDPEGWLDVSMTKVGGTVPVAVWLYRRAPPVAGGLAIREVKASASGTLDRIPDMLLSMDATPHLRRVYQGDAGDIYELANVRPYVAAEGCDVSLMAFDRVAVDCGRPSILKRLELWMPGWSARVDGNRQPVTDAEPFQEVAVGAGRHIVSFDYNPHGLKTAMVASMVTSLLSLPAWFWFKRRKRRSAPAAG